MKANPDTPDERKLDQVLQQWVVEAPLPPRFQEQVWQRISRTDPKSQPAVSFWSLVRSLVETNLPHPKFACSYVGVLLLLGIASGAWAAQRQTSHLNADLGSRYVQSVDPYHQAMPGQ